MENLYDETDLAYVKTSGHSQVPPPKFADWVPLESHSTWKEAKLSERKHRFGESKFVPHLQEMNALMNLSRMDPKYFTMDQLGVALKTQMKNPLSEAHLTKVADVELFEKLLMLKNQLSKVNDKEYFTARNKANPYEYFGSHFFMNRNALKMAQLDSFFHFIPTEEEFANAMFYYADISGGPGGFSEYILWRRKQWILGFGMTETGKMQLDWTMEKACVVVNEKSFQIFYGSEKDGSLKHKKHILEWKQMIEAATQPIGKVFFVCCSGDNALATAESNDDPSKQEPGSTKHLILAQLATTFTLLGSGGKFLCRVFDTYSPFIVSILYIIYQHFEKFIMVKPFTCRPASSEKYVCAENFFESDPVVLEYLNEILDMLEKNPNEADNLNWLVEPNVVYFDKQFVEYLKDFNLHSMATQVEALESIFLYVNDRSLMSPFTPDLKERCFTEWKLPLRGALVAKKKEEEFKKSRQEKGYNPLETSTSTSQSATSTNPQKSYTPMGKVEKVEKTTGEQPRAKLELRPAPKRVPRPKEPEKNPQPQGQFVLDSKTMAALAKYKKH